jgi:hypothetical protein
VARRLSVAQLKPVQRRLAHQRSSHGRYFFAARADADTACSKSIVCFTSPGIRASLKPAANLSVSQVLRSISPSSGAPASDLIARNIECGHQLASFNG